MWVTNNFLRDGFKVMDALGFRYVTNAVWCKDKMGLGQYLRGKHELLLFGVCGKMTSSSRSTSSVIGDGPLPRRRHSQKPDETYDIIEAVSQGPYLEIFALQEREGWDCWGNDIYEP
jgi:N6-adenosine-specific RNA methylase IME4